MQSSPLQPLADVPTNSQIMPLPKADLHIHAEADARLDRVLARRRGQPPYDWRVWARQLLVATPPGVARLVAMGTNRRAEPDAVEALDADPDNFLDRVVDLLEEGAADEAILIEVRFGRGTVLRPDFMRLFREAERRVQQRYPRLRAEAIISGLMPSQAAQDDRMEHVLQGCLDAAREGLAGVDIIPAPYATEANWTAVYRWAERAAAAGLGITAHAGEFATANIAAALRVPGLTRLGHAVYAARDPQLLEQLARSGVTVECCLTCNVILGAVPSYEAHPIRQFMTYDIPVTLNTDDPVRVWTTIGREYAIAAVLGLSTEELLGFTRDAVQAAFVPADRRALLLSELRICENERLC